MAHPPSRPDRTPLVSPGQIDHHVNDMTATFAGGVTLGDAQKHLAASNQWLPVDGDPAEKLGTLVLRNSTGPLRLGFGAWRDLLLGAQFVDGEGKLLTVGGRVVKNVAGYDLTKFIVGSNGAFGNIVSLTTRCYLRPAGIVIARFAPEAKRVGTLLHTDLCPQYALLTRDSLICGYAGDDTTLAFYETKLHEQPDVKQLDRISVDDDIDLRRLHWAYHRRLRASVPPASIETFVRASGLERWGADATFGIVVGSDRSDVTRLNAIAKELGGWAIAYDDEGKPVNLPLNAGARAIVERLKKSFDPDSKLAARLPA